MDLIAKASGGHNTVGRPQARATWYPAPTLPAVQAEVYWRYVDEPAASARLIGTFAPRALVSYPYNPLVDKDVIISTISIAGNGARSVRELADADEKLIVFQRETTAPTVGQVGAATHTLITLAIDDYASFATKRKVRTADDSGMTVNVTEEITEASTGQPLPRLIDLTRTVGGAGTRTIYVRVSHSSGGEFSAESAAQDFTYADSGGAGGDTGDIDPFPRREYTVA